MTLKDFLALPFTNDFCLLNSIPDIGNIPVEYISILEPPVENFVRTNEIVLSTALSVRDKPAELYDFIYGIHQSGAAALVFAFPNNDFSRLASQLPVFEKLHFPIISMSWDHLFSDVVENTLKEIWAVDREIQSYLESMQRELLNYYIQGKSLDDAAELLYKYLASDIIILDPNHHILGRNRNIRDSSAIEVVNSHMESFHRIEIVSSAHLYGYVLIDPATYAITLHTSAAIQCISTPLTLWFDREWSITAFKMKSKEDFVWKLAQHEFASSQDAFSKADLLGFKVDTTYACLVAEVFFQKDPVRYTDMYTGSSALQSNTMIEEQVILSAQEMGFSVMTAVHKHRLIIFLETLENTLSSTLAEKYLDYFELNIRQSTPTLRFLWGYDNLGRSIDSIYLGYKNAVTALRLCQDSNGTISRSCFQHSILPKVSSLLSANQEIVAMANSVLKDILAYDTEKNTDYLETLKIYMDTNYNVTETARVMHLHRQSLLYRLEKLESLCNLSLKKHEDLFLLEICIMIIKNQTYPSDRPYGSIKSAEKSQY